MDIHQSQRSCRLIEGIHETIQAEYLVTDSGLLPLRCLDSCLDLRRLSDSGVYYRAAVHS
jgi:hypothetical protein